MKVHTLVVDLERQEGTVNTLDENLFNISRIQTNS